MPDMKDIHVCAICGTKLQAARTHVDTCSEKCYRQQLTQQRADQGDIVEPRRGKPRTQPAQLEEVLRRLGKPSKTGRKTTR